MTGRALLVAAVALGACRRDAAPPPPQPGSARVAEIVEPIDAAPPRDAAPPAPIPPPLPCPAARARELGLALGPRWHLTGLRAGPGSGSGSDAERATLVTADGRALEVTCARGQFGAPTQPGVFPGVFVEARESHGAGPALLHRLVLSADGAHDLAVAPDAEDALPPGEQARAYRAIDLDGDGADELLARVAFSHRGTLGTSLVALGIRGGALVELGGSVNVATTACPGSYALVRGSVGATIVVTATGGADGCPPAGPHTYALVHDELVELGADAPAAPE